MRANPFYTTPLGDAYLGEAHELLQEIESHSIDLIVTSPPFALQRKKKYGNPSPQAYWEWFRPFAVEMHRVLKYTGSLFLELGGTWLSGMPVRSLYHLETVRNMCLECGFYLAQEIYWYNPAKLPTPAEWVTVRRQRVKDAVTPVWWLSSSPEPKANNRRVLTPYSDSQKELVASGRREKESRPSEHVVNRKTFAKDNGGAIPPNLISASNTSSNDLYLRRCRKAGVGPHPARFVPAVPEFAIALCSEEGDLVLDPFAGSNMVGEVCERMGRRWTAFEINHEYLTASRFRFGDGLCPKHASVAPSSPTS